MPDRYRYLAGKCGENIAAKEYEKRRCRIIARNWRFGRRGEIDLILEREDGEAGEKTVVFSEVKLRKDDSFAPAAAAVNAKKQMRIRMLASVFLSQHPELRDSRVRFDVVQVYCGNEETAAEENFCDILENAF